MLLFLGITLIEAIIVYIKINEIKEHVDLAKEIVSVTKYKSHMDKLEAFILRMYNNYKGMLFVLVILILILNLIASVVIYYLYELVIFYLNK